MVRQAMMWAILLFFYEPVFAEDICSLQDYDSSDAPDFDCPSPEEMTMIPRPDFPHSVPVRRGDVVEVEWDGALVHRDRLLYLGLKVKGLRRLRWTDRLRLHGECQLRVDYLEWTHKANIDSITGQRDAYRDRVAVVEERLTKSNSWYKHPILWFTVGFISAGALVALAAYTFGVISP